MKVLVALDGSPDWRRTVGYLERIAPSLASADIVLYHVLELEPRSATDKPPGGEREVPMKSIDAENETWLAERRADIEREVLEPAREALTASGVNGDSRTRTSIAVVTDSKVAENIIRKVRRESYDTLIVGRRSEASRSGMGSVTSRVVRELEDCSVWVLA